MKHISAFRIWVFVGLMIAFAVSCSNSGDDTKIAYTTNLPDGVAFVKRSAPNSAINFEQFKLSNGLTVILHEDHSDPLVHVDVRYHAGSNREVLGRSGFAHLFEHMMFQGSANVADEEHFAIVSDIGGQANGEVTDDWTNYHQTVPANQLETILWLEADRMGFLLSTLTQEKFEIQRSAVKNERALKFDDVPYGTASEKISEATFPHGHPYSWHRIGYPEDLDAATLDDVKTFFQTWYGPNNAVLTIGGDIDKSRTLAWIAKYFSPIPTGPDIPPLDHPFPNLETDRYISMTDKVSLPLLRIDYPIDQSAYNSDEAPLDILGLYLADGPSSPLYQALVETGLTQHAGIFHTCRELACVFTIEILLPSEDPVKFSEIEAVIEETLLTAMGAKIDPQKLERAKTVVRANQMYSLETVREKVDHLSLYQTYLGDADYFGADVDRYNAVSGQDLKRVFSTYIQSNPSIRMRIVPPGREDLILPADNWTYPGRNLRPVKTTTNFSWTPPVDRFDRSIRPAAGGPIEPNMPPLMRFDGPAEIETIIAVSDEAPTTSLEFLIDVGRKDDPIGQSGMSRLVSQILSEGNSDMSAGDYAYRVSALGSTVTVTSGQSLTSVRIKSTSEKLDETLDLAAQAIMSPAFDRDTFERVKTRSINDARASFDRASYVAGAALDQRIYGEDNAFALPPNGLPDELATISYEDAKTFYLTHYVATRTKIIGVSDLSQEELQSSLLSFEGWPRGTPSQLRINPFPEWEDTTIYVIDIPGAAQSQIRFGKVARPYDHDGPYLRARILDFMFGFDFNSRLSLKLREEKGYTYHIRSGFYGNAFTGKYSLLAGVRSNATADAVREIIVEYELFLKEGLSQNELNKTKAFMSRQRARSLESHEQKLRLLSEIARYDIDERLFHQEAAALETATLESLNATRDVDYDISKHVIIIVGDKSSFIDDLKALNIPIIDLNRDGSLKEGP